MKLARSTVGRTVVFYGLFLAFASVSNATVTVSNPDTLGRLYLDISGTIQEDDFGIFKSQVEAHPDPKRTIIRLQSGGGAAYASLNIGYLIHQKGLSTYVPKGASCASGCALIWLAGSPRVAGDNSVIGFHYAFNGYGQPGGQVNAQIGAYLKDLGLGNDAIAWITEKGSEGLNYLTPEIAQRYRMYYYSPASLPIPEAPPPVLPQLPKPVVPVMVPAWDKVLDPTLPGNACLASGKIKVNSFVSVRAGPGVQYREIGRVYNGQDLVLCDNPHGGWYPVVYIPGGDAYTDKRCFSGDLTKWTTKHPYVGSCPAGWVSQTFVTDLAG
jgi:hypothetical protein